MIKLICKLAFLLASYPMHILMQKLLKSILTVLIQNVFNI